MAPRRRQLQSRLSRSARMRGATVKHALGSTPAGLGRRAGRERGVEYVESTPALDALIADVPASVRRQGLIEAGIFVGIVLALTALGVLMLQLTGQSLLGPPVVQILGIVGAATAAVGAWLYVKRWRESRAVSGALTPEERRCVLATGALLIRVRRQRLRGVHERWLRAEGSDWMLMDADMLDALAPIATSRADHDAAFEDGTGSDEPYDWIVPRATILYHRARRTIIEIHDRSGALVYRHPRYQPTRADRRR